MAEFKTSFALKGDKLIHYNDAVHGEEYTCIDCSAKIMLRGGDKVRTHFYHATSSHCSNESILHKVSKKILSEQKKFRLPFEIQGNDLLEFTEVREEVKISDIVADAVGYINGSPYIIEFANTHFIDKTKKRKLAKIGMPCIEMNIGMVGHHVTLEGLTELICGQRMHKELITWPGISVEEISGTKALQSEIQMLQRQIEILENNLACSQSNLQHANQQIDEIYKEVQGMTLKMYFKKECDNGAYFFTGHLVGKHLFLDACAFLNEKSVTVKLSQMKNLFGKY